MIFSFVILLTPFGLNVARLFDQAFNMFYVFLGLGETPTGWKGDNRRLICATKAVSCS